MNIYISSIHSQGYLPFRSNNLKSTADITNKESPKSLSIYGDDSIRTNPAQLSLFHMHDFHGQNIRMERAYSAIKQFDNNILQNQNSIFEKNMPIDKLKLCSGDMFLGANNKNLEAVHVFMNISDVIANAIGNHDYEGDADAFVEIVGNRKYRLLGANMHPDKDAQITRILSDSIIVETHGNRYGIVGLSPIDMIEHTAAKSNVENCKISDLKGTLKDLQSEVDDFKKAGVNKIILLSHLGFPEEQYIAQNISDIDIILGGHTHNFLPTAKEGENLFQSPKGEPVLIVQVGRDGEHIAMPNIKFNELGQITNIQYNVLETDKFPRNLIAKSAFEEKLGKPKILAHFDYVEDTPRSNAYENPNSSFITDCMRKELNTDIAVINANNIRNRFFKGDFDERDLSLMSPFGDKMLTAKVSEKELVDSINASIDLTLSSPVHPPGVIQTSGLRYEYSKSQKKLTSMSFVDKNGIEHSIDVNNPQDGKTYIVAVDKFAIANRTGGGLGLENIEDKIIKSYDFSKEDLVKSYLKKHPNHQEIKSDGRIKVVE